MTRKKILELLRKEFPNLKRNFGVKKIALFGSFAKNRPTKTSDIDILVEFNKPTFDNFMDLKFYLVRIFHRKVDLVIRRALKPRIKHQILKEASYAGL